MTTMASADTDAQSIKALERFAANLGQMNEILERTDSQVQKLTDKMRVVEQKVGNACTPFESSLHQMRNKKAALAPVTNAPPF